MSGARQSGRSCPGRVPDLAHSAWRKLPLAELETEILAVQRMAVGRHLTPADWKTLDRMRKRAAALRREGP